MADRVLVIGRGRAGKRLARALGRGATTTKGRSPSARAVSAASVIVIAVPDPAIESVARSIAPSLSPGAVVLHLAGSRDVAVLEACRARGAAVGVMHPVVAITERTALDAGTFVIDGDRRAVRAARAIAERVGAAAVVARLHGPAYHAAAALAANGTTALATRAVDVLVALGMTRRDAQRAIGGLLRSVADNVATVGVPAALTGPIARGDDDTVRRHRSALARVERGARRAYDAIAPVILEVARDAGLDAKRARAIGRALRE